MKTTAITLLAILTLSCFGCASQVLDDASIAAQVKGKLAVDTETSALKIGVDVVRGVVTLSGVVPNEREKTKAEQIARNTQGVTQVVNNITINPETLSGTNVGVKVEEAVSDATILARIKAKLLTEGITGTNVDVANGVVTIRGEVDSEQRATQVADIARSTSGVISVNNQLTVKK